MKRKSYLIVSLVLALSLLLVSPATALFLPSNGQAATLVLGQPDFVSSAQGSSLSGMWDPEGIAVDPTSGKVFVADSGNHRILRFQSVAALVNGAPAETALNELDYAPLTFMLGLAVDSSGRLWVADTGNHRILRYDNAATKGPGDDADGVLGQRDFFGTDPHAGPAGMRGPYGVGVDANGTLWVADTSNNRVLRFDNAASKPNGASADGVLGQPDLTTVNFGLTTQSGFNVPVGVTPDAGGHLWVADAFNSRVLRFDNAAAKPNGANADGVLGQPDFTSNGGAVSQNRLARPSEMTLDSNGRLFVVDEGADRVLAFNAAASLPNGANATFVLGQPDFVTFGPNTGGISASTLNDPWGAVFDPAAQVLWVSDTANNRVLMYGQPFATVHITPFIGLVRLFLPPGVTPIGSISIQAADGSVRTFDVLPDVRILPTKRAGQIGDGSFVTVLTRFDEATGNMVVFQIVVHPNGVGPGATP